ncbi:uncharacterized protein LOC125657570 [Ostrea edulis]|uniref:uncharacterized protein LOC125657570 n=1 Tax=Ostrea edulis TaxID=37623 RepID=UPI0024AFDE2F|nr:uncharacterized protein LOC125657570 [Ostrea edulis]
MTQAVVTSICALFLVLSLAAFTHCQDPSDQNLDLLRQILEGDVDIITNQDLSDEEEEGRDDLSMPYLENDTPSFQKRFCGFRGCRRRRRYKLRARPQKRLFCNFGGCFSGKRSVQQSPKLMLQELIRRQ